MEVTRFVTMSVDERKWHGEALEDARQLFLNVESSPTDCVAAFLVTSLTCSLPWTSKFMNLIDPPELDAVEELFRLRTQNQRCLLCRSNLVSVLLECGHAFCDSCMCYYARAMPILPVLPMCPCCIQFGESTFASKKMIAVLGTLDRVLMYGGNKLSKNIILCNNKLMMDFFAAALRGMSVEFFLYGEDSTDESLRRFIESDTRTVILPFEALEENTFFFPPYSNLLLTYGVDIQTKNLILSHLQTIGDEDTLFTTFFVAKNSIEEVISHIEAQYSLDLIYGMLTVASFLPDN